MLKPIKVNLAIGNTLDFLNTPFTQITKPPSPSSTEEFKAIFKTASLCLRESDNIPLRFAAVRVLSQISGARESLTRFDSLVYFSCLEQMVNEGEDEEKLFASTVLLKCNHADSSAIKTIISTGLGRMSAERNEATKLILVGLPHRYYLCGLIFKLLSCYLKGAILWRQTHKLEIEK